MDRKTFGVNIPILLIFLFLTTVMVTSFHHHADLRDHSDCVTCKAANDLAANDTPQIFHIPFPQIAEEQFVHAVINIRLASIRILRHSRAPPKNNSF
jgi:hypothetical protein